MQDRGPPVEARRKRCVGNTGKTGEKSKPGTRISFGDGLLVGEVVDVVEEGNRLIHFEYKGIFEEILDQLGQMPLPPYITHQLEGRSVIIRCMQLTKVQLQHRLRGFILLRSF